MKTIWIVILSALIISCDNMNGSMRSLGNNEEFTTEGSNEPPPSPPTKDLEWSDGNYYSYDYTENINTTDSLGNEIEITIYKQNPPSEIYCNSKVCKWCSKEVYADNYEIVEYPNINWIRGEPDLSSIFSMFTLIFDGKKFYDLDNNRIRTEWRVNCNYNGPDGFCSLKCENEYRYR